MFTWLQASFIFKKFKRFFYFETLIFRQTSTTFHEKTGAFRKIVGSLCDLVSVNAPHLVPAEAHGSDSTEEQRGWWFSQPHGYFKVKYSNTSISATLIQAEFDIVRLLFGGNWQFLVKNWLFQAILLYLDLVRI